MNLALRHWALGSYTINYRIVFIARQKTMLKILIEIKSCK